MGFGEFGMLTSSVVMKMKLDTSEARAEMKKLTGSEKEAMKAAIELAEAKNKQMDRWAKGLALVSAGAMLVSKSAGFAADAWKAYEKSAMAAGGADAEKARSFRSALNSMGGAVDRFAISLGGVVANMAPMVELAADFVVVAGEMVQLSHALFDRGGAAHRSAVLRAAGYDKDKLAGAQFYGAGGRQAMGSADVAQQGIISMMMETGEATMRGVRTEMARQRGQGGGFNLGAADQYDALMFQREQRIGGARSSFAEGLGGIDMSQAVSGDMLKQAQGVAESMAALSERERKGSIFESIFGAPTEMDMYREKLEGLSGVLSAFSDAALASFEAWKDGSLTASEALKAIPKAFLSGIATMAAQKSLVHFAEAVESLIPGIFFNPAAAAGHAKLGAIWAGIALGSGAASRSAGGGGGAGAGTAPTVGGVGAGGGQTTISNTYLVGDGFSEDGPAWRRQRSERTVRMGRAAMNQGAGVYDG